MSRSRQLGMAISRGLGGWTSREGEIVPRARLRSPMPWVIAIMIALTSIATAGGLALANMASTAEAEIANGATVQIVEASPAKRNAQAERALAMLANTQGITSANRVPDDQLEELIEPWLGDLQNGSEAIPIPALIDVRFASATTQAQLDGLQQSLERVAPAAKIDAQSSWLAPVFQAVRSLQYLALGLVVLLAIASVAAVWLAARSALGNNRETIEIIHLLGGTDSQIAQVFQRSIAIDAIMGGLVGLALGVVAIVFMASRFSALDSGMVNAGGLGVVDWLIICLLPVLGAGLAMLTARFTVLRAVRQML